ncbi:MAG: N-acyl-L-homoserine lactone synthetase [Rhodobacteraceae bacterium]|nr:N-acyl-L-homoserine lactone synthetase [Paracoccaceae bacterium]
MKDELQAIHQQVATTTLSFANMHRHGELFANLLRARKQSFIVTRQWNLPEALGMEYDQYDNPSSRWIAIHEDEHVLAGARITPTTARCGVYSYMIRDAQRGLLEGIPTNLLEDEAPVSDSIWELTRGFMATDVPQRRRDRVRAQLFTGMIAAAQNQGASRLLSLIPSNWPRWVKYCGLDAEAAGPVIPIEGQPHQCVYFNLATSRPRFI